MSTATEPGRVNAEQTGRRVEELLDRLAATGDGAAHAAAEDLVRALMDFYGAGLARTLALLTEQAGPGSPVLGRLLEDELVAGLLVLHDLHPWDVTARIDRALSTVRAHPAEVLAFDPDTGVLRLRLAADPGGGCGCGSGDAGAQQAVEGALACFAPEVTAVELEQPEPRAAAPVLLQIGPRPVEAG
ncbi:hypothetical protein [Kitasatospora sp. NPDC057223]|uniref:hypothetical protein n=1 Tax=Kitasatospora sp. NPDC057223 TaxID=3346055 RepID=UPI003641F133